MRAVVIANGRQLISPELRTAVRRADLVVCADGGVRLARRLGRPPHVVVGDLDSSSRNDLAWARRGGADIVRHPREKDKTDTELALDYALAAGADEVDFLAVLGGRPDHALANIALLIHARGRGRRARILDGRSEAFLAETTSPIAGAVGDVVSLIPLTDSVHGVTTTGMKYPLRDATLRVDTTLGISNEITSLPSAVQVAGGLLLVVVTHRYRTAETRKQETRKRGK